MKKDSVLCLNLIPCYTVLNVPRDVGCFLLISSYERVWLIVFGKLLALTVPMVTHSVSQNISCKQAEQQGPEWRRLQANAQQAIFSGVSNGVGMIEERMAYETEMNKCRMKTRLKRALDIKGKKKEFNTKQYRNKNVIIINTKITMNFKFLYHYLEKKGYLFCEFKAFRVIFQFQIVFALNLKVKLI